MNFELGALDFYKSQHCIMIIPHSI